MRAGPSRSRLGTILLWTAPLAWLGCGGDGGTNIVLPSLTVTTATTGVDLDVDGYSISVDGAAAEAIGVNATITVERLSDGQHTVGLSGLAANCSVEGENPRPVTVQSGNTTTAAFAIACIAPGGVIAVTTSASGDGSDPDGFQLLLDGADRGTVASGATVRLEGLAPGPHSVGLSGLAANCQVAGENPRVVEVTSGQVIPITLGVTCAAPPPASGTIEITTRTTGTDQDPDGYNVSVDRGTGQPIGLNTMLRLSNVPAGQRTVELLGVAGNCTVSGANPAQIAVPSGSTAQLTFAVTCATPPPGTGSVQIEASTSGASIDPDGYTVRLDAGNPQPVGSNGTLMIGSVSPGSHSVQLSGAAANCTVSGDNPRAVTVTSGQTSTVQFAVTCVTPPPGTGSVLISATTSGSSLDPDGYTIRIDQGSPQSLAINGSKTVGDVAAGSHTVQLGGLAANCTAAGDNPRPVTVTGGQTATVSFAVTCVATGGSVNLRIAALYLTQSTQTLIGSVPLVVNRPGFLRIFAVASGANALKPSVRVRFYRNGVLQRTETIAAPGASTPTQTLEGTLGNSWNLPVDASLIQPGLAVVANVDPGNQIAETNEGDNNFPASGAPQELTTQAVPVARIRFVPVKQGDGAEPGNVSATNKDQIVDMLRRLYPLSGVETEVRDPYTTTSGPLTPDNANNDWNQVLTEIEALRVADPDGAGRTYYGVVKLDYAAGIVGNGFIGLPSAIGTDDPTEVRRVFAHELGHTWGRYHSPCGNPGGLDPVEPYPYPGGVIGVYGLDVRPAVLKAPTLPDIMGYCSNPWISDHTYQRVMAYRQSHPMTSSMAAVTQPCVLIWGHIVNGVPVLEPAFRMMARPNLPDRPGPYAVEGLASNGSSLFRVSFEAAQVADDPRDSRHFAFAVPLDQFQAAGLADLRLTAPGGVASAASLSMARLRNGAAPDSIVARREAGGIALEWNVAAHPMIMVRDPDTGEVLSFARGGKARVWTTKGSLDLVASDGVQSEAKRVTVTR